MHLFLAGSKQSPHLKFQEDAEMPDVHISWLAGRTVDQKRKVVEGITKVLMEEAGAKPESTHIVFVDIPHTDFASGGMLVADKNKKLSVGAAIRRPFVREIGFS
jgi:4-oxalocrotonate tautomerase